MSCNAPLPVFGSLLLAAGKSFAGASTTRTTSSASHLRIASGPAPLPHLGLLGGLGQPREVLFNGESSTQVVSSGSLTVRAALAGSSTCATAVSGALTVRAALAGASATPATSLAGTLFVGTVVPVAPMPLPFWGSLGGASPVTLQYTNVALTGAGADPWWRLTRIEALLDEQVAFAGASSTATASAGTLSVGVPTFAGVSATRTSSLGALSLGGSMLVGASVTLALARSTLATSAVNGTMPLPMWSSLGGASPVPAAFTNTELTGAGTDPWWRLQRAQVLSSDAVTFSGTSLTRTAAQGSLNWHVGPVGVDSGGAVGVPSVTRLSGQTVAPPSVASAPAVGVPSLSTPDTGAVVNVGSVASVSAVGVPGVTRESVASVQPTGVASPRALGDTLITAESNYVYTRNEAIEANRGSAFQARRAAIAALVELLGRTVVDDTYANTSPTQGRKIAGAVDTTRVSADYTGVQDVLVFVSQNWSGSFISGLAVSADYSGSMAVQALSSANYSGEFEALGTIGQEWSGGFESLAFVDADFAGAFLSDGVNSLVDADYAGSFSLLAQVSANYSGSFQALVLVNADYAGSFTLTLDTDADYSGSFEVLALVSRDWRGRFLGGPMGGGIVMIVPTFDNFMAPAPFDNFMTALDD